MIDFKKKLGKKTIEKKINPIELYDSLDRRTETGPLRPPQKYVLEKWFNDRKEDKNLIIKLHTGEGKTLIGLIILQSKLNDGKAPVAYLCPNIYLSTQVMQEADKFGIPYCFIDEDKQLPSDFIEGNKILITHIQKMFHSKTVFGIDSNSTDIDSIILDDSHACIDSIKSSFTVTIKKDHELYEFFINIFEDDFREQGEGSFIDIKNEDFDTILPLPYWSWINKKSEVIEKMAEHKTCNELKYCWDFIKDNIENYQLFISGSKIEITPYFPPIHHIGSFSNASHRILMSATTQDDSFFIKGLGFDVKAVQNPLLNPSQIWSGEKMVLIPNLIDESLDRSFMIRLFGKVRKKRSFGTVILCSSFKKANEYSESGAKIANSDNMYQLIANLKTGEYDSSIVFANRYDGIDLPDNCCRVLLIDSLPYFDSLSDKYEESCLPKSDNIKKKIAQKIEQGLGRSVRGEKDFSAIVLLGDDLVSFVKSSKTKNYFSNQTKKQVELGIDIMNYAKEDLDEGVEPRKALVNVLNQLLQRDDGWKAFYKEEMDKICIDTHEVDYFEGLHQEYIAEKSCYDQDYEKAFNIFQKITDTIANDTEKGWYLQTLARYKYNLSKSSSNTLQKSAFLKNRQLLKPIDGISYKKIEFIHENRVLRIRNWINRFISYQEMLIFIDGVFCNLTIGTVADKFEKALQETGEMLGLLSERPEKEYKKGPDNLWCGIENHYFLFECKSEVKDTRNEIYKYEAGQMNNHCGWFDTNYDGASVSNIMIIPTKDLSYQADFTHPVKIMRKGKLRDLKSNVRSFFKEFKNYKLEDITDEKFQSLIDTHNIDINSLKSNYTEEYYHKTK